MNTSLSESLARAVFDDDAEEVRRLAQTGAPLDCPTKHGNTPLRTACQRDALRARVALLELGANPNERITYKSPVDKRVEEGFTPLMYVTSAAAAEILIERGADVNVTSATGLSALMRHAHFGDADVVDVLLKHGANVSLRQHKLRGRKALTALELAEDSLGFWLSLPKEQLKPEAGPIMAAHQRTVDLLRNASAA